MVSNKFLVGIAALVFAASAQAIPTALTATQTAADHFVSGGAKAYAFNVNDLLAGQGLNSNAISFGQLTVFGHSDAAYNLNADAFGSYSLTKTSTHTNAGACNHGDCTVFDYTYSRTGSTYAWDLTSDTMKVTVGDASSSDTSEWQESWSGFSTSTTKSGSERFGWNYFETTSNAYHGGYSGDLSVTLSLDSKALNDIMQDGILNLSIFGSRGQFNVDSLRLNLLAVDLPLPAADARVPVPTSLLLTGLGLAALATMRRRKA